jgi:DNA-binding response OmpR family regulator
MAERGSKILVVDDDADMRRLLELRLRSQGYVVESAEDGNAGMAAALRDRPDAVLLDLTMPAGNGYNTLRRFARYGDLDSIPIIVVTADASEETRAQVLELGARDLVPKPVDGALLSEAIQRVLA